MGDLAVASKQKFKITPCSLLFFVCEIAKNVGKPQKEAQEMSFGVFQSMWHWAITTSTPAHTHHSRVSRVLRHRPCLPDLNTHTPYS